MSRDSFSSLSCWRIPRKICCNKNSSRSLSFVFRMVSCLWFIWLLKKSLSKMWIVYWFALRSSLKCFFMFPMIGRQMLSVKQILLMNLFWWSNLLRELFWMSSFMIENLSVWCKTSIRLSLVGWSTLLMMQTFIEPWDKQIGFSVWKAIYDINVNYNTSVSHKTLLCFLCLDHVWIGVSSDSYY